MRARWSTPCHRGSGGGDGSGKRILIRQELYDAITELQKPVGISGTPPNGGLKDRPSFDKETYVMAGHVERPSTWPRDRFENLGRMK